MRRAAGVRRGAMEAEAQGGDANVAAFHGIIGLVGMEIQGGIQVIERPHLDPDRQFNLSGIALLLLVLLAAAFTEIYAPMTGLARRPRRPEPQ